MGLFRRRRDAYDDLDRAPDGPAEDGEAGDLHDAFDDDHEDEEPGGVIAGAVSKGLAALVVSGVFAAAIMYAYSWSVSQQGARDENLPVVEAEPGPEKVKPDDPGGMDVPYQDQLVLNQDAGDGEVEQLLPPPEEPKTAETGAPASADGGTAEDGGRPSSQGATAGTNGADRETNGADRETNGADRETNGADRETNGAQDSAAATDGDRGSGEQVARTEPARTPEGTAEPAARTRTAAPSESDDQGQSVPESARSGESSANDGAGDADPGASGERGADAGAETGDTAARTAPTEDRTPAAGSGTFLVQLAAFQNRGNAEKAWQRIQDKHRNVLGNQKLQLQRKRIPDKGIFWRVRTGPFPNRATADDLCGQLKRRGQPCLVMER